MRHRSLAMALVVTLSTAVLGLAGGPASVGAVPADDLSRISWVDGSGERWVVNPDGSGLTNVTSDVVDSMDTIDWNAWLPDGERLFLQASGSWSILDVDTGTSTVIPQHPTIATMQPDQRDPISPDGSTILIEDWTTKTLYAAPTDGSSPPTPIPTGGVSSEQAIWSPDGTKIAIETPVDLGEREIYVIPAAGTATPTLLTDGATHLPFDIRWTPDSTKVLFTGVHPWPDEAGVTHAALLVADADGTGTPTPLTDATTATAETLHEVSPDGAYVTFRGRNPSDVPMDWVAPVDGSGPPIPIPDHRFVTWTPDSDLVLETSPCPGDVCDVVIVDQADCTTGTFCPPSSGTAVPGGSGAATTAIDLPSHSGVSAMDFSPDGTQYVASVDADAGARFDAYVGNVDGTGTPVRVTSDAVQLYSYARWSPAPVRTPLFTDVDITHPFFVEIKCLIDSGITTGYADGTFRPSLTVSRQAMAAFLYRLAGEPAFVPPVTPTFSDVPTTSPFYLHIEWLVDSGITGGYADGTFRPSLTVSRQAMAAFLYRLAGEPAFVPPVTASFSDVPTTSPFFLAVEWLADSGITGGYADGTFRPASTVSRQAMAAFLCRFLDL